jgi:hypothetical protein
MNGGRTGRSRRGGAGRCGRALGQPGGVRELGSTQNPIQADVGVEHWRAAYIFLLEGVSCRGEDGE